MSKVSFIYILDSPLILFLQCRNSSECYLFLLLSLSEGILRTLCISHTTTSNGRNVKTGKVRKMLGGMCKK